MSHLLRKALICLVVGLFCLAAMVSGAPATDTAGKGQPSETALGTLRMDTIGAVGDTPAWTIYFRPAVRFGTDERTLYIMDFLVPLYRGDKNILFFNPKFTPNDVNGWETNLGIGYRHLLLDDKLILGANVYYDTRRTGWGTYWDQVGFGLEAMAEINKYVALTGRFNYYIPLTDPIETDGGIGGGSGYVFRDQGIYSLGGGMVEEALEGFDAELGFRVPYLSDYVETWVYGGGYHYGGKYIKNVDGYSFRLELIPTDFVRLNYEYREDRTNQGEHHGEVAFEAPFSIENLIAGKNPFEGFGKRLSGSRAFTERMVEPVRRDVDIIVQVEEGAVAGAGGLVDEVVFVSEGGEADLLADGSFEHPWGSIAQALGDPRIGVTAFTIHVINDDLGDMVVPGDSINIDTLLLWGSGYAHPRFGAISNMMSGYPTMSSNVVLNGNDMEACGLYFGNMPGSNAIRITGDRANVHNNDFFNVWRAVNIDSGNNATVANNTMLTGARGVLAENGATGAVISGNKIDDFEIGIEVLSSTDVTVTGNTIGTYTPVDVGVKLEDVPGPVVIGSNTIYATWAGVDWQNNAGLGLGVTNTSITNNSINVDSTGLGWSGFGIRVEVPGNINNVTISGNTTPAGISGYGITADSLAFGIAVFSRNGSVDLSGTSNNTFSVLSNTASAYGINLESDAGDLYMDLYGNSITAHTTANGETSYGIYAYSDDDISGNICNNPLIAATRGVANGTSVGIYLYADDIIGDRTMNNPFNIYNNTITLTSGATTRYPFVFFTGNPTVGGVGGGNYVSMTFTPANVLLGGPFNANDPGPSTGYAYPWNIQHNFGYDNSVPGSENWYPGNCDLIAPIIPGRP